MKKSIPALLLLLYGLTSAQPIDNKAEIAAKFAAYFEKDRENLFVPFDKSVFFTEEEAWFKGYVYNKSNHTPFFETLNVFAVLYDDSGKELQHQLVFAYLGSFSGSFPLSGLKSGAYHVRFYTNWMNNFTEDESATCSFQVVQQTDRSFADFESPHPEYPVLSMFPEGGNLIEGVVNNVGIRLTDCGGRPLQGSDGKIIDRNGQAVGHFVLDAEGCGKTYVTPTAVPLQAVVTVNGQTVSQPLPSPALTGVAIEANNYAAAGRLLLNIRTNARSLPNLAGKPLFLVVQQDNKTNIYDLQLTGTENSLSFSTAELYPGMNNLWLLDHQMNEVAHRLVFEPETPMEDTTFSFTRLPDGKIRIYGSHALAQSDVCITVRPAEVANGQADIGLALKVNAYLKTPLHHVPDLTTEKSKAGRYKLDLLLLSQNEKKYDLKDIMAGPRAATYDFDMGLTIKGAVSQKLSNPKQYRIRLTAPEALLSDYSAIETDNTFEFKNLLFNSQAKLRFTLMKIPSVPTPEKFTQKITNGNRKYIKPFRTGTSGCPVDSIALAAPKFGRNVIPLKEVRLEADKHELRYQFKMGNASLRGFKIEHEHGPFLSWLSSHGFNVSRENGHVVIAAPGVNSIHGSRSTPEISISDRRIMTFDELDDIRMEDVDEVYADPHAIVASMQNRAGIVRIYMKKIDFGEVKSLTQSVESSEGFAPIKKFSTPIYMSTADDGFRNFAVLQWQPNVIPDDKGEFHFDIPDTGCQTIDIDMQVMSNDGRTGSQHQTLSLH